MSVSLEGGAALSLQGSCYSTVVRGFIVEWRSVLYMWAPVAGTCLLLLWNLQLSDFFFIFFLNATVNQVSIPG